MFFGLFVCFFQFLIDLCVVVPAGFCSHICILICLGVEGGGIACVCGCVRAAEGGGVGGGVVGFAEGSERGTKKRNTV